MIAITDRRKGREGDGEKEEKTLVVLVIIACSVRYSCSLLFVTSIVLNTPNEVAKEIVVRTRMPFLFSRHNQYVNIFSGIEGKVK